MTGIVQRTDDTSPPTAQSSLVTCLIADVRGYTFYTQEHGDEAAAALSEAFAGIARKVEEPSIWPPDSAPLLGQERCFAVRR